MPCAFFETYGPGQRHDSFQPIPGNVRRELLHSLRARRINHKFHYDSHKQAQKWLALHEACSPSRTDPGCAAIYDRAFAAAAERARAAKVEVIGLGCGGGQKDARLLRLLAGQGKEVSYTPCDVSLALVLTARQAAREAAGDLPCEPLVCDLALADELPAIFGPPGGGGGRALAHFFRHDPQFRAGPDFAATGRPGARAGTGCS